MRINRFYLENFSGQKNIELENNSTFHQIKNVLKMRLGDQLSFFCNFREAIYRISFIDNKKIIFDFVKNIPIKKNNRKIFLFSSLIKKDKLEWVVQKAVELGVSGIIPVISERSEKKKINLDRLNKISLEASEQCGRQDIIKVSEVVKLEEALRKLDGLSFLGDSSGVDFKTEFKLCQLGEKINIFIGPEGGWTKEELEMAKKNKARVVCLNGNILRSETAVVAFLSLAFNL
ncbi:MAG: RsmE family RNA methyltransferase [Patescibacteria group bacterium]|jgi:16S rRNA (uracil1498-N3)-methyltransferase